MWPAANGGCPESKLSITAGESPRLSWRERSGCGVVCQASNAVGEVAEIAGADEFGISNLECQTSQRGVAVEPGIKRLKGRRTVVRVCGKASVFTGAGGRR